MRKIVLGVICISTLLTFACGNMHTAGGKLAIVDWQRAAAQHPQQRKLLQGEAVHRELVRKRRLQAEMAAAQMVSLDKFQDLKYWSEKSYLEADFNTHMAEEQAWANSRLQDVYAEAEAEAEKVIAGRKKELEDTYQLRIFNLRMQLESLKMPPHARREAEKELQAVREERALKLGELEQEKRQHIAGFMKPHLEEAHAHMRQRADELRQDISARLNASADKYDKMLGDAPGALRKALQIMDREIDRQREENERRGREITSDMDGAVAKIARARGYDVVFREYKVNVRADDITEDVIAEIKKVQGK